jgi:enamine deaminase RidA (YjgF/YER057c/UK114 family)
VKRLGSLGEAARFHHSHEGLHRIETVHPGPGASVIVWDPQMVIVGLAGLSARQRCVEFLHRDSGPVSAHSRRRTMAQRDVVFPAGRQALYEKNRYSPAIRSNGFLFVSGQVGSRPDGSVEPDLEKQVRLAFDNLNAILMAAGCTFDDVIDVTIFIVDPESKFDTIWKVLPDYWGKAPHPTLTGIGVTWLYGFQFEIKVIAKLPDQ